MAVDLRRPDRAFTIRQLCVEFKVTPRALRFYEDKGLLSPARDGLNRVYHNRDRARLQLILRGKRVGFSLAEIREILDLYDEKDGGAVQAARSLTKVRERIEAREIRHLSVFALAPQPLLIELGRLLCDIAPADIHQLHREPKGWRWPVDGPAMRFRVRQPTRSDGPIALVFALSATVTDDRITDVLGADAAIWAIEAEQPHNDIMKRPADLAEFRQLVRSIFNTIKERHGERAVINIFPAMPVSAAVEVGRVWMPKADLPLVVFDQNRTLQGFVRALQIGGSGSGEAAA